MSELADLQRWMADALQRRRAVEKDPALVERARVELTGNDRVRPEEQLEIYREQFWLRHTSCLLEDFEGLAGVIGQQAWERLVEGYLEAHPPKSFTLRDLGKELPAYVEAQTWLDHHELCVDMARVEWCYVEVFDAADSPPLDPMALASIADPDWPQARLELTPALRLLAVSYPVASLRRELRTANGSAVAIPEREPQKLVVYRAKNRNMFHQVLTDTAFALLSALADGLPLEPACERALTEVPEAESTLEASLGEWFQDWANRGFVAAVRVQ
ncbi:MAG: putative DNA-binding domain-containing protein [Myxococcales bacterium]|nr:putative DNA-binding domain-containing protein [Myxococcales bacterium]MCB9575660.1 putative DNA-binding domain-containing protein [Polyangiaceae bacterium]